MTHRLCAVDGCFNPHEARNVCKYHYRRQTHPAVAVVLTDACGPMKTLPGSPLAAGISYRQLDHWTRRGYLVADNPTPGSGHRRHWPDSELAVARRMKALIDLGFAVPNAARIARVPDESSLSAAVG